VSVYKINHIKNAPVIIRML